MDEATRELSAEIELEIGQKLAPVASGVMRVPGAGIAAAGGAGGRFAVAAGGPSEADLDREVREMLATEEGRQATAARLSGATIAA